MDEAERLARAFDAAAPAMRDKMVEDLKNAYIRGQVEAAVFLRDTFAREGNEIGKLVCGNYACLTLVGAKLATFEDLQKKDRELVDFVPK